MPDSFEWGKGGRILGMWYGHLAYVETMAFGRNLCGFPCNTVDHFRALTSGVDVVSPVYCLHRLCWPPVLSSVGRRWCGMLNVMFVTISVTLLRVSQCIH